MADELELIYWDACIFYEYLKDEQKDTWKRQAIEDCLRQNEQSLNRITTSAITHLEVLPAKLPPDKEQDYWGLFDSMYFYDVPIDRNVIQLSREIRNFYYRPEDKKAGSKEKIMSLGDAIHLATAIIEEVDLFYTRDKNKKGGNIPLIGLPENSPGGKLCGQYDLKIVNPASSQGDLMAMAAEVPAEASAGGGGEPSELPTDHR